MSFRSEPTLAEVRAECDRLKPKLLEMLSSDYRLREIRVVRRVTNRQSCNSLAECEFFDGVDGAGKVVDIVLSTEDLDRHGDWKHSVFCRLVHEMFHIRTFSKETELKLDLMIEDGTEYNKYLDDFIEECGETAAALAAYFAKHYQI